MTTLAARQGPISHRPRMSVAFISVLIVVVLGVAAAVMLPRLLSSQPSTTRPATVAPPAQTQTSNHSGFPTTGVDEWPRPAAQPSPGAKHPLGRALRTGVTQTDSTPRQLRHGHLL
jgi:hypothetical protein